jgi:hypothetical protein
MARIKRVLSGAAKDAFLKRLLATETGLDDATRARLTDSLQDAISMISARWRPPIALVPQSLPALVEPQALPLATAHDAPHKGEATSPPVTAQPFDPFTPNVIVVFRTRGREAVLDELAAIDDVECLRLLAREQQLGIDAELADPNDIRQAIAAAAERRVANRRAAAS